MGKKEILNIINNQMENGRVEKTEFHYTVNGDNLNINSEIETVESAIKKVMINK